MSSINGSTPYIPAYQPASNNPIDNDTPRPNPQEKNPVGDDAEVLNGKGGRKNIGDHLRADFNRKRIDQDFPPAGKKTGDDSQVNNRPPFSNMLPTAENTSDDSQVNNRSTFSNMLPTAENASDDSQVNTRQPFSNMLPTAEKASDDSLVNIKPAPMDVEIKSDGNGGWIKA